MFSAFFIKRPKFAMVVSLFITLAGLLCINRLPVAEHPEIAPPAIMVFGSYPDASAEVIADTVAAPLEAEINGIEHMVYYSSKSDNTGSYSLTLTFESDADADMALVNVNNAIKRAEPKLPSEITKNGLTVIKRTADFVGIIAFTSDNPEHTPLFLSNYVSINVKDAVSRISGVGQATIFGEMAYSMRVWLDPIRMRALDIGYEEVLTAIQGQNIQAASGSIGNESASDSMQFKVDTQGRLADPEEFADIIVRSGEEGRQVRLSDIAEVELGSESYGGTPHMNGEPAAMLAVSLRAGSLRSCNNNIARLDLKGRKVIVSADGGRIRLRENKKGPKTPNGRTRFKGEWREPKLLCAYFPDKKREADRSIPPILDGTTTEVRFVADGSDGMRKVLRPARLPSREGIFAQNRRCEEGRGQRGTKALD